MDAVPLLGSFYRRHSARLKRAWCLAQHRVGRLRPSSFVLWIATYRCNYRCPFCEAAAGEAAPGELTTEEARALIEDLQKMRVRRWLISGGEPLLRSDLPALLDYAASLSIRSGLISNSSLIETRWPELKHFPYFVFITSLDGTPEIHDPLRGAPNAFRKVVRALDLFASIGVPTRVVNTVVHPGNLAQLPGLMQRLESTGATDWNLCPTFACGRATGQSRYQLSGSELRTLVDFVHDRRERRGLAVRLAESCSYLSRVAGWESQRPFFCGAGLTRCAVMPNGDVVACGQAYEHGPSEGNIRLTPLPRIWKEGFADLRRNFQPAECRRCRHWHACQGGCWARRQMDAGCFKEIWTGSQGQDGHASRSL